MWYYTATTESRERLRLTEAQQCLLRIPVLALTDRASSTPSQSIYALLSAAAMPSAFLNAQTTLPSTASHADRAKDLIRALPADYTAAVQPSTASLTDGLDAFFNAGARSTTPFKKHLSAQPTTLLPTDKLNTLHDSALLVTRNSALQPIISPIARLNTILSATRSVPIRRDAFSHSVFTSPAGSPNTFLGCAPPARTWNNDELLSYNQVHS
jgi:hypothetical protein